MVEGSERIGSNNQEIADFHVPVFTVAELQHGNRVKDLAKALATSGLISVEGTEKDSFIFSITRHDALSGLCVCMKGNDNLFHNVEGADRFSLLSDGSKRMTLATATVGDTPLSLPTEEMLEAGCSSRTVQSMEKLRDHVAWVSHSFVSALDQLLLVESTQQEALLETARGNSFTTLSSIIKASHNLEHFHIYETPEGTSTKPVLDVHTDAGLFLAFVPGMQCDSVETESKDFYVQHDAILKRAIFREGSVGVMLGVGAENWLRTSTQLRATRHAVSMQGGQSRAWYGISKSDKFSAPVAVRYAQIAHTSSILLYMASVHMVPQDAIIQDFPKRTFADMRNAMVLAGKRAREFGDSEAEDIDLGEVAIGCGSSPVVASVARFGTARINRRRLQMVSDASACNNVTNFFCWFSCLDIPKAENAVGYIKEGFSLYCLDPATLASSGNSVSAAQEKCSGGGVIGGAHDSSCMGSWQPTAPSVQSQAVRVDDVSLLAVNKQYCYGGTTMYMDGFHWTDPTCIIYLVPNWVLTTPGSLVGACIGTIFFGMALEAVIWKRRAVLRSFPEGLMRLGVTTAFYGLQLTMGYMLMLVVMTYSGPLFMCVIVGLMSGHAIFNAGSTKIKNKSSDEIGSVTEPFYEYKPERADEDSNDNKSSHTSEPTCPEGITPCCQNSL